MFYVFMFLIYGLFDEDEYLELVYDCVFICCVIMFCSVYMLFEFVLLCFILI